jgi:hypothetical protein
MWAANHRAFGSETYAGYHNLLSFPLHASQPTPVLAYNRLFYSGNALNIQTAGNPSALQPITPVTIASSYTYSIPYPSGGSKSAFRVNIATQAILGTPLQVVTVSILPITTFGIYVTQAYKINYTLPQGILQFSSLVSAISSTMPTATNAKFSPIWMMPLYNGFFSNTPSLANVGAYLSSVVVYVDNKAMQEARQGKWWTVSVVGVV